MGFRPNGSVRRGMWAAKEKVSFGTEVTLDPGVYEWQLRGEFMANTHKQLNEVWFGEGGKRGRPLKKLKN